MSLPHEIAEQQARCDEYNRRFGLTEAEPAFANELDYLEYVWRDPTKPDRLRYMAAKACADFHFPTLKAVAQIKDKDFSSMVEAARLRRSLGEVQRGSARFPFPPFPALQLNSTRFEAVMRWAGQFPRQTCPLCHTKS
jgi:hypothetical protein